MKIKSICSYFVLIPMLAIASCLKQDQPPQQRVVTYPPHPMAGKEIQFDSLAWQDEEYVKNVFISIENRYDIFLFSSGEEVFLRLDTSSVWKPVNGSSGFVYSIGGGRFFIAPSPPDTSLSGSSASVKIRF